MSINTLFRRLVAPVALCMTLTAHAGIPVIDVAAVAQALLQVQSWAQQYKQMVTSLEHAKGQLDAIKGGRGMGLLLNDPSVRNALGADFTSTFDKLRSSGSAGASAQANAIYGAISTFGCSSQFSSAAERRSCEAGALATPSMIVVMNESIDKSQKRAAEINKLIAAIDGAPDTKAAADLQNRIGSEVALLNNEKALMDMALAQLQAQEALGAQQRREAGLKRLKAGGVNPFAMD